MSLALAIPVVMLAMLPALQFRDWQWASLVLASPVAVWGAWPFHRAAIVNARHGAATMDTLVSAGVTALILLGRYLEARAKRRSGAALRTLLSLGAKEVAVIRNGAELRLAGSRAMARQGGPLEFVLVHGTTQSPVGWDRLVGVLGTRGHDATAIDLPTNRPEWTVADYAREAAAQAGQPAGRRVVVGHSGAGVLLPAIAEATQASAMVWLAAYVPDLVDGQSMAQDIKAHRDAMLRSDWLGVDPTSDPQLALRFLFHDCDPQTQQWALGTRRLFNPGPAVYQHTPGPLPPAIMCSFILPTGDRTLRPEWMRQAARRRLGVQPVEVDAGHCPHVCQPETIASILAQT